MIAYMKWINPIAGYSNSYFNSTPTNNETAVRWTAATTFKLKYWRLPNSYRKVVLRNSQVFIIVFDCDRFRSGMDSHVCHRRPNYNVKTFR